MNRFEQAKELREQGLTTPQIAEKMGIAQNTASVYIYRNTKKMMEYTNLYRKRTNLQEVRELVRKQLCSFNLPSDWEDQVVRMWLVYQGSHPCGAQGRIPLLDVNSLILLLCRREKVPAPRELIVSTWAGKGAKRLKSGYVDALKVMDGVEISKPLDYVMFFVEKEKLRPKVARRAERLISKIPRNKLIGKNPRVVAGAVLYEALDRIYTQEKIAKVLEITNVGMRNVSKLLES